MSTVQNVVLGPLSNHGPYKQTCEMIVYLDAVVMEVRVGQELIGGVVLVRGQELAQKVAVAVWLGGHVVGQTKEVFQAHVSAEFHFVQKERPYLSDVQVV